MLQSLHVQNYALIKSLNFTPSKKFNTITGETGAGKSIMLGALGLILGQRADTKSLLEEDQKCIVEGTFNLSAYHLNDFFETHDLDYESISTIRREIAPSGKSRAFINDTPTTLDVLKELGEQLVDIHSQHDTLFLKKNDFQLALIDAFANSKEELKSYQTAFASYIQLKKELDEAQESAEQFKSELDYNTFLLNELTELNIEADEEQGLEEEMTLVDNAEIIKSSLSEAVQYIDNGESGANSIIYEALTSLKQIHSFSASYNQLYERLQSTKIELEDIARELESENENIEYDGEKAASLKNRYDALNRLFQKHHVTTTNELLTIQEDLEQKVDKVSNLDQHIEQLKTQTQLAFEKAGELAEKLSEKRTSCFPLLSTQIKDYVSQLGMPDAQVEIKQSIIELSPTGIDDVSILFSANKGVAPVTLKQAASGGEMSRLMFAIKYIMADKVALPTVIFDEIDTGISGEIALQMGNMMNKMAENHQVIAITHLPQLAGKGDAHFYVYKDTSSAKTNSAMKQLSSEERVQELAEMIGGKSPSDSAYSSARELLGS